MTTVSQVHKKTNSVDWLAFGAAVLLCAFGLLTMNSFTGQDGLFVRQLVWLAVGVGVFFGVSCIKSNLCSFFQSVIRGRCP